MAKTVTTILGAVFVLIGILGFIEPVAPDGELLGIFAVSTAHNIVHLASGLVALAAAAQGEATSRMFAQVFGVVYALVTVLGFVMGTGDVLGFINVNQADNVLHLALAAVLLYVGFAGERPTGRRAAA